MARVVRFQLPLRVCLAQMLYRQMPMSRQNRSPELGFGSRRQSMPLIVHRTTPYRWWPISAMTALRAGDDSGCGVTVPIRPEALDTCCARRSEAKGHELWATVDVVAGPVRSGQAEGRTGAGRHPGGPFGHRGCCRTLPRVARWPPGPFAPACVRQPGVGVRNSGGDGTGVPALVGVAGTCW